jgi:hypothetical protein
MLDIPKGITRSLNSNGDSVITLFAPDTFNMIIGVLVCACICGVFVGNACVEIVKLWLAQKGVDSFFVALSGWPIALLFILMGVGTVKLLWAMWNAEEFASVYSCCIVGLKLFMLFGGWSADSFFMLVNMWLHQESVIDFFSSMPGLLVVLFWVGFVIVSAFLWVLFKRTIFTLGRRTLVIEERVGSFVTRRKFQRSNVIQFSMAQDEDGAPMYDVVADMNNIMLHRCTLLPNQSTLLAVWFCSALNEWLADVDKTDS